MEMFIFGILLAIFGGIGLHFLGNGQKERVNALAQEKKDTLGIKEDSKLSTFVEYCGGHPDIINSGLYNIDIYSEKIIIYPGIYSVHGERGQAVIDNSSIQAVRMLDHSQIVNNPKISSLLVFGVAGLGIRNKDKIEEYYIVIDCKIRGNIMSVILGSGIMKYERTLLGNIGISLNDKMRTSQIVSTINSVLPERTEIELDKGQNEVRKSTVDTLRELGELQKEGIITEQEFIDKKRELLASIKE